MVLVFCSHQRKFHIKGYYGDQKFLSSLELLELLTILDWEEYEVQLNKRLGLDNQLSRVIGNKARNDPKHFLSSRFFCLPFSLRLRCYKSLRELLFSRPRSRNEKARHPYPHRLPRANQYWFSHKGLQRLPSKK